MKPDDFKQEYEDFIKKRHREYLDKVKQDQTCSPANAFAGLFLFTIFLLFIAKAIFELISRGLM